jgi:D-alanyl-D-alanine carboxypeptidase/D-alanyl-D-alanine-endopeptidase (penicillin-binding protein 4)
MRRSRAVNNVRAKAGFLNAARSLSGYIFTGDREPIAFSIIVNNYTVPSVLADRIQDLVCIRLANFRRK